MSTLASTALTRAIPTLRHEPTAKRIRATLAGETVVDSTRAVLLWEPRRLLPSWAVPAADVAARLEPASAGDPAGAQVEQVLTEGSDRPVLGPSIPFAVHTAPGQVVDVIHADQVRRGAGLRLDDPDLDGYVVFDFGAFDDWWEEDEPNVGHPRNPFHRIDILSSSRHVRVELDGEVLADSRRPVLLFETTLPVRSYLPRADITAELVPSTTRTTCAYKGHASYFSAVVAGREVPDVAWTYPDPLRESTAIAGLIAFFDERVDVILDDVRRPRPITLWSRRPQDR